MTGPGSFVATVDPVTKKIPLAIVPTGAGGLALYDDVDLSRQTILSEAQLQATDVVTDHIATLANATPGTVWDVYCRGGVQPERATITSRVDIFLAYCMPSTPVIGGAYGIEGDGHRPVLVPDALCDIQGWT